MGRRCVWGSCSANTNSKSSSKKTVLVRFPSGSTEPERCQQWINACAWPPDRLNLKMFGPNAKQRLKYAICTKHFIGGRGPTAKHPNPIMASGSISEEASLRSENSRRLLRMPMLGVELLAEQKGINMKGSRTALLKRIYKEGFTSADLDAISEKIQDSCEIERNNALVEDEEEENEEEAEETTQWIVVNNEVIPKSSYLESCMDSEVPGPSHADSCAEREESCPVPAQESAVAESGYASDDIDCPEPIAIFGDTATIIKQEPVESVTEVKPSSGRKRKKPQWLDTYQTNFSKKSKLDVDAKKGEEHLVEGKPLSDEEEYLRNCLRQLWFRPIGTLIPEEDIKKEPDLALPDSSQPGSDGQADVASFGMPVISEVYSESASYGLPSSSSVAEKGRGHRKVNGAHSRKAVKVNGKNLRLRNRRNSKKSDHTDRNKSVSVSRVDRSTATVKRKTRASKTASKNGKENASKAKNGPKASLKMQSLGSVVERKQLRSKVKVPHWLKNYSADVSPLRRSKTQVQSRRSSNRK